MSPGAVDMRLSRARNELREKLARLNENETQKAMK
jgi:hypothetical protein